MQLMNANIYLLETFKGTRVVLVAEIGGKTISEQIPLEKDTDLAKEIYNRFNWMFNNQFFLLPLLQNYIANHDIRRQPRLGERQDIIALSHANAGRNE